LQGLKQNIKDQKQSYIYVQGLKTNFLKFKYFYGPRNAYHIVACLHGSQQPYVSVLIVIVC